MKRDMFKKILEVFDDTLPLAESYETLTTCFPEFYYLAMTDQNEKYHQEGNALRHTIAAMHVIDSLALSDDFIISHAVMLHDIGKSVVRMQCPGGLHEKFSALMADVFLDRWYPLLEIDVKHAIINLVANHMRVPQRTGKIRKLKEDLLPATIEQWYWVGVADCLGRTPVNFARIKKMECVVQQVSTKEQRKENKSFINGKFLIAHNLTPSPLFSKIIKGGEAAELNGLISSYEEAEEWFNTFYADLLSEEEIEKENNKDTEE